MEWVLVAVIAAVGFVLWLVAIAEHNPSEPVAEKDDPERNWYR